MWTILSSSVSQYLTDFVPQLNRYIHLSFHGTNFDRPPTPSQGVEVGMMCSLYRHCQHMANVNVSLTPVGGCSNFLNKLCTTLLVQLFFFFRELHFWSCLYMCQNVRSVFHVSSHIFVNVLFFFIRFNIFKMLLATFYKIIL